jgi:hypothetical protein
MGVRIESRAHSLPATLSHPRAQVGGFGQLQKSLCNGFDVTHRSQHTGNSVLDDLGQSPGRVPAIGFPAAIAMGGTESGNASVNYYGASADGISVPRKAEAANLALQVIAYRTGGRVLTSNN